MKTVTWWNSTMRLSEEFYQFHLFQLTNLSSTLMSCYKIRVLFQGRILKIAITFFYNLIFMYSWIQVYDLAMEDDYSIFIDIIDRSRNCERKLAINNMLFSGDRISKGTKEDNFKIYDLEIRYVNFFFLSSIFK